jgi:hypothetical protein
VLLFLHPPGPFPYPWQSAELLYVVARNSSMPDLQTVAVVAGVAAVSSALSVVATSYLLPLWQARCSSTSSAVRNTGYSRARTPAPSELSTPAPNAFFTPVDKQKRPDPYDTRARSS